MEYHIKIDVSAQQEMEQAMLYYYTFRKTPATHFIANLENACFQLRENPFKPPRYKSVRVIRLEEFPFALYFTIQEHEKQVIIHSCFQDFRNPRRKQIKGVATHVTDVQTNHGRHFSYIKPFSVHKARGRKVKQGRLRRMSGERTLVLQDD